MTQIEQAKYESRNINDLQNWDKNPRTVTNKEFERLKEQIKYLGLIYKPLIINQQNIVLGGNVRLEALKQLGVTEVMCAVVLTDNEAQMLEIALSDNDQAGVTDKQKVAEMAITLPEVKSELFAIHSKPATIVSKIKASVSPTGDNGELRCRQCPLHCGMDNM